MTNQELATCAINDIPIKVAVINNGTLGMVRQWQSLFYNERYSNTDLQTHRIPDFVKLADAYGCHGLRCESPQEVDATIEKAMSLNDAPVVIDFQVHKDAMVWPMVPGWHQQRHDHHRTQSGTCVGTRGLAPCPPPVNLSTAKKGRRNEPSHTFSAR